MKIKKNTFSTLVLELFSPSIATCKKLKLQKIQNRLPLVYSVHYTSILFLFFIIKKAPELSPYQYR
jgi:hypothetical protein